MQLPMKLRLFSTQLWVSYPLICVVAIVILLGGAGRFLPCAAAVVIHESGHLTAMKLLGYFPERIKISPVEITITDSSRHDRTPKQNLLIIFFGPFFNFICFLPIYLLYLMGIGRALPYAAAQLSVGLFNLLPVMSLDGGQMIFIFLCAFFPSGTSETAVNVLTIVALVPLAFMGFMILFESKYNFSLLLVCVYLMVSLLFRGNKYY